MSSNENRKLGDAPWVNLNQKKSDPLVVWLGLTAICAHCGELIEIVDMADEGPCVYPPGTFDWRHGHGYFSCNRDGAWPMAEPSL